jgi:hypothetical protein
MNRLSFTARWVLVCAIFVLCIAPTFISYRPYAYRWDDAEYLAQSLSVSKAFWASDAHGLARIHQVLLAMRGIRPPAMTLLGLPWGSPVSWDAAGKCFVSLGFLVGIMASLCLFLLARIGVKPALLVLASICVCASFGPWPPTSDVHFTATAFMADSLFSWITLAALLLIPYEARTSADSLGHSAGRGLLWGLILSAGAMTKISFLYFVVLIAPILMILRYRRGRARSLLLAVIGCIVSSAPAAFYLQRYGASAFANAGASSFGGVASLYKSSLLSFLGRNLVDAPGLCLFVLILVASLAYFATHWRSAILNPDFLALVIVIGFGLIVLASSNRQLRYAFPAIVSAPFLLAVLFSRSGAAVGRKPAFILACLAAVLFGAAALPTGHRAERQNTLGRADAVVNEAYRCNAHSILLATGSPTMNGSLLTVAVEVSGKTDSIRVEDLGASVFDGSPIDKNYQALQQSDLIVFQDDKALYPQFLNIHVPAYRNYISRQNQLVRASVWQDVSVFSKHCR